jgi:uncharacterized protein (TIGR04222 family)
MLTLAIISFVAVLATIALTRVVRRQSLRAPAGTDERVLELPDLAYLAGGPARAAVCALNALVCERVISISDDGVVTLTPATPAEAPVPVTVPAETRALVVDTMTTHDGSMPLGRLWDKLLKSTAMVASAKRLRREHLLLAPDYRPPAWSRALIVLATLLAIAALAWSAAKTEIAGIAVGAVATAVGAVGGWRASTRHGVPLTDAGRTVLISALTHYRRGGMPDMSGHAAALLGAAAFVELHLRDRLRALEQATPASWSWKPTEKLDDTSDAPSTIANSVTGITVRRW